MRRSITLYIAIAAAAAGGAYLHARQKVAGKAAEKAPALVLPARLDAPAAAGTEGPGAPLGNSGDAACGAAATPAPLVSSSASLPPAPIALPPPSQQDHAAAIALFRAAREVKDGAAREAVAGRLRALESAALARAERARAAADPPEERAALTVAYLVALDPNARAARREALDALAREEFFSGRATRDATFYTVERGDSLTKIAARFDFPVEGIQRINRLKGASLRVGERLKIPKGPVEILVVKGEFRLVLLCGGKLVREYRIGTGRDGCTPEAEFRIEEKIPEPTWHSKEGVFPYGHPKNILGTRWLGFNDTAEYRGFGIHGTPFPESIGQEVSSGCIRMRNEDVEELFSFVPRGATVTITK
jgi:LysM repeat protein